MKFENLDQELKIEAEKIADDEKLSGEDKKKRISQLISIWLIDYQDIFPYLIIADETLGK